MKDIAPLPPLPVDRVQEVAERQVESAVPAEIGEQVESELEAVAPVRLSRRLDRQDALAVLPGEIVLDGAEHVEAVELEELRGEPCGVERLVQRNVDALRDDGIVEGTRVLDPHLVDDEIGLEAAAVAGLKGGPLRVGHGQRAQAALLRLGGDLARLDRLESLGEVGE